MATAQKDKAPTTPPLPDPAAFLNEQIAVAEEQMETLRPQIDAFHAWERYAQQLIDVRDGKLTRATTTRRPTEHRAGRGDRPKQFLRVVADAGSEGIAVKAAADQMDMGPNYLYRLAPALEARGLIEKVGRHYRLVEGVDPEKVDMSADMTAEDDTPDAAPADE
jgi:hypothetical protein